LSILLIFLAYVKFVIMPLSADSDRFQELAERKKIETEELNLIVAEIKNIETSYIKLNSKYRYFPETLSLLGYIEKTVENLNLKIKIIKLNQKDSLTSENQIINYVYLQLSGMEIEEAITLLNGINSSAYTLKTNSVELKNDTDNKFSLSIEIQSAVLKK
ncbi:MAG TPA: hypothetical protein PLQ81_11490, partial [bacterium]|nr:hypothetical protein [bacterium]